MKEYTGTEWFVFIAGAFCFCLYAIISKKATLSGALSGVIIAIIIFIFTSWEGILYFSAFFLMGSIATKWKIDKKQALGLEQENKGNRTHIHAISNTGAAAFLAALLYFLAYDPVLISISVASVFAAANSDTLSSELGNIAGSKYFNIISLKRDTRGKDGVISPEGTVIGLAGSSFIALIHFIFHQNLTHFLIIMFCGFLANLVDSLLGATLQKSKILNNHSVNFTITTFSGSLSILIYYLIV